MWVDSHCHLQLAEADPGTLLDRASDVGVTWVVVPGVDAASSRAARDLAAGDDRVKWASGVHPHHAAQWGQEGGAITELAESADAIGEIGLDYYRSPTPRQVQVDAFRAQLDLAMPTGLPVLIHCRDAFSDMYDILAATGMGPRAVMHCWTAGPRWTRRFRDLDVTFSYAGPLAFPSGETIRLGAAEAPPDRTLVETDTPLLSPPPFRDEENEPARVAIVGEALAEVWGMEPSEVARATTATAERVFGG